MAATRSPYLTPGRPRRLRSFWRDIGAVLMVAGCVLILDAALTVAWQDPVSGLLARISQDDLGGTLNRAAPLTAIQGRALGRLAGDERRIAFLARTERRRVHDGQPIGRIRIPRIGANYVVVEGTSTSALTKGPGHYPATPFPGLHGTVAIAGHRTTYLAPFHDVNDLKPGDPIVLQMPYARFTYAVEFTRIVDPTDVGVTRAVGHDRLVLTACHPLYSAAKRIVIFARLRRTQPLGPALRTS
jgi:sortase A